jgi:hypothetical protein
MCLFHATQVSIRFAVGSTTRHSQDCCLYLIQYFGKKSNSNVLTGFGTPNLATPRSTVPLHTLTVAQLATKFPTFYQNRKFITIITIARLSPTSYIKSIEATPSHFISSKSTFILPYYLYQGPGVA